MARFALAILLLGVAACAILWEPEPAPVPLAAVSAKRIPGGQISITVEPRTKRSGVRKPPGEEPPEQDALSFFETALEFLDEDDLYSAVQFLAFAQVARPDLSEICVILADAYHRLNWVQEAAELLPCLHSARGSYAWVTPLMRRIARSAKYEAGFERAESEHFIASYPTRRASAEQMIDLLDRLERTRLTIAARTGLSSKRPVSIVVYERGDYQRALGLPDWVAGAYGKKIHLPLETFEKAEDYVDRALGHEYVHALLGEHTRRRLPSWLGEGLANLLADVSIPEAPLIESLRQAEPLPDLEALSSGFNDLEHDDVILAYQQSYWMAHDLIEEHGWPSLGTLIRDLRERRHVDFDAIFARVYEESPGEYLERWYDRALPVD